LTLRRLIADEPEMTPAEALADVDFAGNAPADRPYVVANMVATVDGRATVAGRSGPIGGEADRELFHRLRTRVDAVMVGSGTLRVERYGALVRLPELRAAREEAGLPPLPLGVVVSRSLDLPLDIPLFADEESRMVVYTQSDADLPECGAQVDVVRLPAGDADMVAAMSDLRAERGVRSVLCEGGPRVLGALIRQGVLDELFLSVAPKLSGGIDEPTIVTGPPLPEPVALDLVWALDSRECLFLRYAVRR
jgi:riboflavin-specific deaminase-like protein